MSETKRDYQVGRGKPPVRSRFRKGQSRNPRTASDKLARATGRRAQREGGRDHRRRAARSPSAARSSLSWSTKRPAPICAAPRCCPVHRGGEVVMATFITRLRQSWEEELRQRGQEQCSLACSRQSSGCRQRCMAGHKRPQKLVGWAACPPRIGRSPVPEICQSAFF